MIGHFLIFFGSSRFSLLVLDRLLERGIIPSLIVTKPDAPQGRGLLLASSEVKTWGEKNSIPVLQPRKLRDVHERLKTRYNALFLVASFGKIIPEDMLAIPKNGWINIHPSLLPKYRGPSPLPSQILNDEEEVGVSLIRLDAEVDHGPLFLARTIPISMPVSLFALEEALAQGGADAFADVAESIADGVLQPKEQNHAEATVTKKFSKEDGLISMPGNERMNYLKFLALSDLVGVSFYATKKNGEKKRAVIKDASFQNETFVPLRVVPEGGKEMGYQDFLRGL